MQTITPTFTVDGKSELRPLEGRRMAEFQICDGNNTVLYKPRRLLFLLEYDQKREYTTITDLRARLSRECDADSIPRLDELRTLAIEAMQVFLLFSAVCISRSPPPPRILWLQPEPSDDSYGLSF